MADELPVLTDKKFLGSITVDGTSTLTGAVAMASTATFQQTAPTLTAGAEATNVIPVTFASPVASVEQYIAQAIDPGTGELLATAFTLTETGTGAEVFGTTTATLVFTTDSAGAAEISMTDVVGGSGESPLLVISPLFVSADTAFGCAPVMIVLTFD